MTAIFISHSSIDNEKAAEIKLWLEGQGHTALFLDFAPEAGIRGAEDWEQAVYRRLNQCQAVIVLLTPAWLDSKWCFAELALARGQGKPIFPLKAKPCESDGIFSDIQHLDITREPEKGLLKLHLGLVHSGLDPHIFDWDPKRPPYPGLAAFQEEDAAVFFGRGRETLKIVETLDSLRRLGSEAPRLLLLLGASGSGKSSLVRAGVIPRLKKRPSAWLPLPPFRPEAEPLDGLAMAMAQAFESHGRPCDWHTIRDSLYQAANSPGGAQTLLKLVHDLALAAKQAKATVLLTLDQAEELFGHCPPEAAARFLRLLRAALEAGDGRLMTVACLRSGFFSDFHNHPVLQDGEYPHHFRYRAIPLDTMPVGSFPEIIQGPAKLAGLKLGDGLVESMVNDAGIRDALPLLAFTLRHLYDRFGDDGQLTLDEYESTGLLQGSIREIERAYPESCRNAQDARESTGKKQWQWQRRVWTEPLKRASKAAALAGMAVAVLVAMWHFFETGRETNRTAAGGLRTATEQGKERDMGPALPSANAAVGASNGPDLNPKTAPPTLANPAEERDNATTPPSGLNPPAMVRRGKSKASASKPAKPKPGASGHAPSKPRQNAPARHSARQQQNSGAWAINKRDR